MKHYVYKEVRDSRNLPVATEVPGEFLLVEGIWLEFSSWREAWDYCRATGESGWRITYSNRRITEIGRCNTTLLHKPEGR